MLFDQAYENIFKTIEKDDKKLTNFLKRCFSKYNKVAHSNSRFIWTSVNVKLYEISFFVGRNTRIDISIRKFVNNIEYWALFFNLYKETNLYEKLQGHKRMNAPNYKEFKKQFPDWLKTLDLEEKKNGN
jgi:hypothetical protein